MNDLWSYQFMTHAFFCGVGVTAILLFIWFIVLLLQYVSHALVDLKLHVAKTRQQDSELEGQIAARELCTVHSRESILKAEVRMEEIRHLALKYTTRDRSL